MNTLTLELQARRDALFLELRAIDELLGLYQVKPGVSAKAPTAPEEPAPRRRGGRKPKAEPKPRRQTKTGNGSMAETILAVCRGLPSPFKVDAVWAVAREKDPAIRNKLVSDTLGRFVKNGVLKRAGWGAYALAELPEKEASYRQFRETITTPTAGE